MSADAAEIVVIGGGPCAAVAARELVNAGHSVTMLDAGRRAPRGVVIRVAGRTLFRWVERGFIEHSRHRGALDPNTVWTSSQSEGGLSNFWTGVVTRFAPEDFSEGEAVDERFVWPVSYDALVPYYELVEDDLRITDGDGFPNIPSGRAAFHYRPPADWQHILETARLSGHSIGALPVAKGSPWMVALRPREFTSHHCVVRPFRNAPNFRLVRGAQVLRIGYRATEGRADSVTYVDRQNNQIRKLPAAAVVVAAGPLDSTEILLRSVSAEFPAGLGNSHRVLGRYLHDHLREWWPLRLERPLTATHHPLLVARDMELSSPLLATCLTIGIGAFSDHFRDLARRPTLCFGVQVLGSMIPSEQFGVSLIDDRDPDTSRSRLRIELAYDDAAVANLYRARGRLQKLFDDVGNPATIGPFHGLAPGSSVHFGGTVRMHQKPEFGVLDGWNRLHDVPNVVVCDASSFTTGPEKHPTLTAMAISARAARHLAKSLT